MKRITSYLAAACVCFFLIIHYRPVNTALPLHMSSGIPVDCVIFSYNRPLQLYALLESMERHMRGVGTVALLYRTDQEFAEAYNEIKRQFPCIRYYKQGENPREDFRPLLKSILKSLSSPYIMFAVDDQMVKDKVNLCECTQLLESTGAYAFYLRLSPHITFCYSENNQQKLPEFTPVTTDVWQWSFRTGSRDWNYPNSVDMTIYRREDVVPFLGILPYDSPNTLEANWAIVGSMAKRAQGLCFEQSKVVNIPLNLVQNDWKNRTMNAYSPKELLAIFNEGKKINIDDVYQINNVSAHMEFLPSFTNRTIHQEEAVA